MVLYGIVWYCIALYCIVCMYVCMYCIVLYCIVLYCIVLYVCMYVCMYVCNYLVLYLGNIKTTVVAVRACTVLYCLPCAPHGGDTTKLLHAKGLAVPSSPYIVFGLNCPYLGIFALNFTISAIFTSMQNFRAIGPLFMEIWHFKDLGDTSVTSECSLGVNLVIDNFFDVASNTLPLYKILKQLDHINLWRYCILKIWGIQVSSANAVWVLI